MTDRSDALRKYLQRSPVWVFTVYGIVASFATYSCMYAFRKPFSAAKFQDADGESLAFWNTEIELKTALVISQLIGYALSKYLGIKLCSEVTPAQRVIYLISTILMALAALVGYGMAPDNWKFIFIFLSGLPLGMVWGLVVWYLEGRTVSEVLLAGLSCSFIISSAVVKDVGLYVMNAWDVSEGWMPAVVGLLFLAPFFVSVWMLNQLPPPSNADVTARTHREPMDGHERIAFCKHFIWGLLLLAVAYFFLTAYRDYRDNYQVELFAALDYPDDGGTVVLRPQNHKQMVFAYDDETHITGPNDSDLTIASINHRWVRVRWRVDGQRNVATGITVVEKSALPDGEANPNAATNDRITEGIVADVNDHKAIISQADMIVAFGVMVSLGLLFLIRNNRFGLIGTYVIMITGVVILGGSTWLLEENRIDGFWWMTFVGLGVYLAYVPYGSVLFDRLIAQTHVVGTAVFAIYIMDALGYTGSVAVQLYRDVFHPAQQEADQARLEFFINFSYVMAIVGFVLFMGSLLYFLMRTKKSGPLAR